MLYSLVPLPPCVLLALDSSSLCKHPQLRVFPAISCLDEMLLMLPHSHLHFQYTKCFFIDLSGSKHIRRPNLCPRKSSIFIPLPPCKPSFSFPPVPSSVSRPALLGEKSVRLAIAARSWKLVFPRAVLFALGVTARRPGLAAIAWRVHGTSLCVQFGTVRVVVVLDDQLPLISGERADGTLDAGECLSCPFVVAHIISDVQRMARVVCLAAGNVV